MLYAIISISSIIIRNFYLPNPFEEILINKGQALSLNFIIGEPLLYVLSFTMCGIFYNKGGISALGSLGYLFFYFVNTAIIIILAKLISNLILLGIIYAIIIIIVYVIIFKIRNYFKYGSRSL